MGRINVLPFAVANLIAAGEVVDRPASVIKELMENAIDAGADRITVEIQNGGVTFMRVTDNGCGMSPEDLPVAIRRHATSKIKNAEDLDGIMTLGFRGEALAAIASVSDLRIISKTADAQFGAVLEAHGGEIVGVTEQGCSTGTSVIIENLFANVPARRKFLKKDVTEAMAVTANVEKVALSNPHIAFRLIIDGNMKLETAGDGNLHNTVYAIFGRDFASRLITVNAESDGISVSGFIGRSDNFKANRNYQNFFINGRFVKSKTAMAALEQAYTSYMPPEKFPCCVLYIKINPSRVDVNVHPAKLEVKFSNEKAVFEAIYYTVRTALESNATRPNVELSFQKKTKISPFAGRVSDSALPVREGAGESLAARQISYKETPAARASGRMTAEEYRSLYAKEERPRADRIQASRFDLHAKPSEPSNTPIDVPAATPAAPVQVPGGEPKRVTCDESTPVPTPESAVEPAHVVHEEPLPSSKEERVSPEYRIVGEVFHTYVIVECEDKMLLVDKHAAHERIIFESLKAGLKNAEICSQMLMLPIDVMMTSGEVEALRDYESELSDIGFSVRFARNTVSVDAIPEGVETDAVADMLGTMAGRILTATGSVKLTRDIIFEKALYQASCKAALKAGRAYADEHIKWIIGKLMELPDITFCPHGRPVALEMSHHALDKQFDRTGF
ncbi:MAG: DNA mismatch repair endonuclease MutL [Ruminococcaceae bacterium]|nr:DNA mismatch repair endonuclease MutL [Oscillospiraceae bacterium]